MDLKSSELDLRGADTPFPKGRLSDETLDLLNEAKNKLEMDFPKEQCQKSSKRRRRDQSPAPEPSTVPERYHYPPEYKPVYLRLKNNYRKKITLASQISKMHGELLKKVYPSIVEFKFNFNRNRNEKIKQAWSLIIDECKQRLTKALLDEMVERYSTIKNLISQDFVELEKILSNQQLQEIRESLQKRTTGMAPLIAMRTQRQYVAVTKQPNKQPPVKKRKFVPANRRKTTDNNFNLCSN